MSKQPVPVATSPSKNKLYQHIGPKVQSKLPVSVAKKTSNTNNENLQKETQPDKEPKENETQTAKHAGEPLSALISSTTSSSSSSSEDEELNRLNE